MNIALVTYLDKGKYDSTTVESEDDKLLNFLKNKGLHIEKVIWDDPDVNWEHFQLAVLKSPWDYFDRINEFHKWLDHLETKEVKLLNPIDVVRWNTNKHYLKEIEATGLAVTPSVFISKNDQFLLNDFFEQFNSKKLIVKPCVSGGAKNTFKVTDENVEEINNQLQVLVKEEDFIVQPFLSEIIENGEWSFIFFNGT
ncbi:MAG: hypothetical protein ABWZ79_05270 [Pedobacter agri]